MPSDLTGFFGNKILRWLADIADMPTRPADLYIALYNGNPKTSGVEVGATINSTNPRQLVTFASLASGVGHLLTSDVVVDFGLSEADASFSHIALVDDPDAGEGNMYASKATNGGVVTVLTNSSVKFPSGQVQFNIGSDT
jgi:hypothetical protein